MLSYQISAVWVLDVREDFEADCVVSKNDYTLQIYKSYVVTEAPLLRTYTFLLVYLDVPLMFMHYF